MSSISFEPHLQFKVLKVLEAGQSKVKKAADLLSDEDQLPGSYGVPSCCVLTWWKRERQLSRASFIRALI
jgi:hypothetical protein